MHAFLSLVIILVGNDDRVGAPAVLTLLAGLFCELQTDELHNLCLVVQFVAFAVLLKPSLAPSVRSAFAVDQLIQYYSFPRILVILHKHVAQGQDRMVQYLALLSKTSLNSFEACIDKLVVHYATLPFRFTGHVVEGS